jgi:MFS superfamily sulfate permease-like transporter
MQQQTNNMDAVPLAARLKYYMTPVDGRYEDLFRGNRKLNFFRDFMAGLIVAMVAIPLAMGFAMASGLRPEQGIVGGAVAGLIGALFGGSKYQVYGPTAAFIPVIGGLMAKYDYGVLVLASIMAGVILMALGVARAGRIVSKVPHSIIVGFTIGIAVTIALSQAGEILGIKARLGYSFLDKINGIRDNIGDLSLYTIAIGLITFAITKLLIKVSPFIPSPLVAIGVSTLLTLTLWRDKGVVLVHEHYGPMPDNFLVFSGPAAIRTDPGFLMDLAYYVVAIIFVAAVESLLCSRMADRLADNRGLPFNPNKELWGQGLVNIVCPLFNGFPHTGALARTATNIKLGAISPLAGICKFGLKLLLAVFLARGLELVPMAAVGGILLYVAVGMVKPAEVRLVLEHGRAHTLLMAYTAVMVVATGFLPGVLSALIIYGAGYRAFRRPEVPVTEKPAEVTATA